jgi:TolB protein
MLKILLIFVLIFVNPILVAQETDAVTIVAVGDAEQENEKLAFASPNYQGNFADGEKKVMQDLYAIMISDFSFYKHLFDVQSALIERNSLVSYAIWKKQNYRYVIESTLSKAGEKILMDFNLYDVVNEKSLMQNKVAVDIYNIRTTAHEISHGLYRAITGKESIFKSKILFVSDRTSVGSDTRKEIYLMDFDGERKQRITYENSMIISPALSPDNSKIMYSIIESKWQKSSHGNIIKAKNINLYIYDLVSKQKTLVSELDGINSGAIFAADGEHIYLTLSHQKNADIYKMNLKTKQKTQVTNHFLDDVDPHINADGNLMTFLSGRSGKAMIYTLDPRALEKDVKRISFVGKFNAAPRFTPDGREIVFSSWVDERFDIYKIDAQGNNLVRLTKNFGSNEEPWFSPDGQFVVFSSQRVINSKLAVQDLYIMNREGEVIARITDKYGKCYTPRWSN